MTAKDIIGIVLIAVVILLAIDKCNSNDPTTEIQKSEESAHVAIEASYYFKDVAKAYKDSANYWKNNALKSDSLRLIAVRSGAERRDKIRSLPKEEKKRLADSSHSDVHEWALICADSLIQAKTELALCDSGRIAVDSANSYFVKANEALTLRGDTLQFALGQKDIQIEFWKKQAGKKFWTGFKTGFVTGAAIGTTGTILLTK